MEQMLPEAFSVKVKSCSRNHSEHYLFIEFQDSDLKIMTHCFLSKLGTESTFFCSMTLYEDVVITLKYVFALNSVLCLSDAVVH